MRDYIGQIGTPLTDEQRKQVQDMVELIRSRCKPMPMPTTKLFAIPTGGTPLFSGLTYEAAFRAGMSSKSGLWLSMLKQSLHRIPTVEFYDELAYFDDTAWDASARAIGLTVTKERKPKALGRYQLDFSQMRFLDIDPTEQPTALAKAIGISPLVASVNLIALEQDIHALQSARYSVQVRLPFRDNRWRPYR